MKLAALAKTLRSKKVWIPLATAVVMVLGFIVWTNLRPNSSAIAHPVEHRYSVGSSQFKRTMGALLGPPIVAGNRIAHLKNGEEIFPAMLEAIAGAEETVCFETFVYWEGEIARRFSEALAARAQAGVRVHVLLDWIGLQQQRDDLIAQMRRAGVEVELYNKPAWYRLDDMNYRTHRKLLIVDGRLGFTGGVGIADEWQGDARDPRHWRDSHFRVEGPAVRHLQAAFMDNWMQTHEEVHHNESYFPPLQERGTSSAQVFISSPRQGPEAMRLMVFLALAAASRSVYIATPYFVPDEVLIDQLRAAARRGVRVRIIVPGRHIDSELVRHASRSHWGTLLQAGVEIYQYHRTMYHTKLFVVDDAWVSIGSANFDPRSLQLNDEANLNVYDPQFASEMVSVLEDDLRHAEKVALSTWAERPWTEKVREVFANLLDSQL